MRLRITLTAVDGNDINLPVHYNYALQGLIYASLDPVTAGQLHNKGYSSGSRTFRLFTFSALLGRRTLHRERVVYSGPVELYVAAVDPAMLTTLAENLVRRPEVRIAGAACRIQEAALLPAPQLAAGSPLRVRTLAPITVYSTMPYEDGRKRTHYYSPFEPEWQRLLVENLERKAAAAGLDAGAGESRDIRPMHVTPEDHHIVLFKGTVIKGWTGQYELLLPAPLLLLAYDSGLGAKNAQGFGMIALSAG